MNENANYRIRLHGHTNGNYTGKIVSVGPSQDFFSLQNDVVTTTGSAKHLSELRADVIRDYLVANSIQADRIEVKAWGGKRPIYDKKSVNAKKNVRGATVRENLGGHQSRRTPADYGDMRLQFIRQLMHPRYSVQIVARLRQARFHGPCPTSHKQ
jgi:outer membrane protein OmpA-like peptidoglycan-associated protein